MMDYIFELDTGISLRKRVIDNVPDNNLLRNELINRLSEPYDEENFKRYTEGIRFCINYRGNLEIKRKKTADGRITNYGHMLGECGDRL